MHTATETRIEFKGESWLDFDGLREGLAYLVLIMSLFDVHDKNRPQLYLLLEALFYGYLPESLKTPGIMMLNQLKDLAGKSCKLGIINKMFQSFIAWMNCKYIYFLYRLTVR